MTFTQTYISSKVGINYHSAIAGRSAFAIRAIRKDELVAIKNGHIITKAGLFGLSKECQQYCLQIDDNFFIGPKTRSEIKKSAGFVNHSCEPNIGNRGDITIVALRDIRAGEELTHDYATSYTIVRQFDILQCNCGNKNCRRKLTGADWKIRALQKKYSGYFSPFIQKKINAISSH